MTSRRATVFVGAAVALAIAQIVYDDVLFFLGATGGQPERSRRT